ncbi:hypothetical protein AGLY_008970 [Aphis glycines]|uniref:MULE transposase domain-containing protein n=1 Tax=Aphis glycines TaxID=307491 RepID=A0A6G0TJA8_APHGL|nr:hypothetical protein AGLY_008970 [Aphis glycines]
MVISGSGGLYPECLLKPCFVALSTINNSNVLHKCKNSCSDTRIRTVCRSTKVHFTVEKTLPPKYNRQSTTLQDESRIVMDFKIIEDNLECVIVEIWFGGVLLKIVRPRVTTCNQMKNLLKTKNTHKHEQVETFKIKIKEIRNECKRKAFNNIHEPLRKIIRIELLSSIDNNTVIESNDVSLIRKSMDYERRKYLPTLPRSLEDALNFVSNCDILTCQNEKMTYVYKQDEIIIVTCKKNIEFLCNHCDEYLTDEQVLTIKIIHLDFEIAAHNAVQKSFTGVKVKGCRFHFGQALWRKIQSINKLRPSYNNNQNETDQWLEMFFGLHFYQYIKSLRHSLTICPYVHHKMHVLQLETTFLTTISKDSF